MSPWAGVALCLLVNVWANEDALVLMQTRAHLESEAVCTVSLFVGENCEGEAFASVALSGEDEKTSQAVVNPHQVKSYKVVGAGCGDVELYDDEEEMDRCSPENEWWDNTPDTCRTITDFDVQDDVNGVSVYAQGGGQSAHCSTQMLARRKKADAPVSEAVCTVSLFVGENCEGEAFASVALSGEDETTSQAVVNPHQVKSYKVVGAGCGDVELYDDEEEMDRCSPENEWWDNTPDTCRTITDFDVQDDVNGVSVYAQGGGQSAHCSAQMLARRQKADLADV